MKLLPLTASLIGASVLIFPHAASAASLPRIYTEQTLGQSKSTATEYSVDVRVDTVGHGVTIVEADLNIPADLTYKSQEVTNSAFSNEISPTTVTDHHLRIIRGTTVNNGITGDGLLVSRLIFTSTDSQSTSPTVLADFDKMLLFSDSSDLLHPSTSSKNPAQTTTAEPKENKLSRTKAITIVAGVVTSVVGLVLFRKRRS